MKGKDCFPFEYGLHHQMTSDNRVPIKSIGKVYWAQLDTKFLYLKLPPLPLLCSKVSCHLILLTALSWQLCTWNSLRSETLLPQGGGQEGGAHSLPCEGPIQVDRSVTRRPHSCSSKEDSKQTSKSFMIIQFLFQLPVRSRGKL